MVQSPSWEANWFAASQKIPCVSQNSKVHYRTHKRLPPCLYPVHIPTSCLLVLMTVVIKTVMSIVHRLKSCFRACILAWLPALSRLHCLTHENLPSHVRCVCKILWFGIEILLSLFVWQALSCFCVIMLHCFADYLLWMSIIVICIAYLRYSLFVLLVNCTCFVGFHFGSVEHISCLLEILLC